MSRLSDLAALLHLHAERATSNPHPIHLGESVATVFHAIGRELQAMHDDIGHTLEKVATMGADELQAIVAGFKAGTAGAFDGASAPAAPAAVDGLEVTDLTPQAERAQRMYAAFAACGAQHGFPVDPWETLPAFLRGCWIAAAGVQ